LESLAEVVLFFLRLLLDLAKSLGDYVLTLGFGILQRGHSFKVSHDLINELGFLDIFNWASSLFFVLIIVAVEETVVCVEVSQHSHRPGFVSILR
jgi:hypothetical protein